MSRTPNLARGGRVKLAALTALAVTAVAAPSAQAAERKYEGAFVPSGTLSFVVKKSGDGKKVVNYRWDDFPLDCRGGDEKSSSFLEFSIRVRRGKFSTVAVDNPDNPGARLQLEGRLIGRNNAKGTMRLEGRRVPVDGPGRENCDSGRLNWTAARVASRAGAELRSSSRERSLWERPR